MRTAHMRISKVHDMVLDVLQTRPSTRKSDALLHIELLQKYYGVEVSTRPYFLVVTDKALPSIESVGRARRKIQEMHPELRADGNTEAARMLKEEEYLDYARKHK